MIKITNKVATDNVRKVLLNNFLNDTFTSKINLLRGVYRDDDDKPYVLESVKEAKKILLNNNHEYLDSAGDKDYINHCNRFIFGKDYSKDIISLQSLSGTGALHLGGKYLYDNFSKRIHIPNETWSNHEPIFKQIGFDVKKYPYYENNKLCINKLLNYLDNSNNELFLFHSCAHNPTGVDLNKNEWEDICDIVKKNNNLVFFDNAYQGFATGDYNEDAFAPRFFLNNNVEFVLSHSFSKNFGLYSERCGLISLFLDDRGDGQDKIKKKVSQYIRTIYSNPPSNGSNIVKTILSDEKLFDLWKTDCNIMSSRIKKMRKEIGLKYVEEQIGMFGFLRLNIDQIDKLIHKYHIYIPYDGRISLAGLNKHNIDYFNESLHSVLSDN